MRAAGAVILIAAVVVLSGCGGGNHARRNAVNEYFDRVDAAQTPVRLEAGPIQQAFARFSTVHNTKSEMRALVRAQTLLERVQRKVQRVRPPGDARRIHADLVRLYGMQAGVASELVAMTHFVPRYEAALVPLKPAHAALTTDLKAAKGWRKIAAAFGRYRSSLAVVLAGIARLSPPATLRPAFEAERTALQRSTVLCASIENALAKHDVKKTAAGVQALAGLGAETSVARVQRAQLAAAKAYNARLARISSLTTQIGRERNQLVGSLG